MKKQVFMLLALCVAGVASAASVKWGTNDAFGEGTHSLTSTTAINGNVTVSIVISGMKYTNWVATQTGTRLFTVYGANGTGAGNADTPKSYFDVYVAANGKLGWGVAGNAGTNGYTACATDWSIVDLFGDGETLELTFTKPSNTPSTITLSTGDKSIAVGSGGNFNFADSYVWDTITVTSLPEPGVLTLLALGVAGLALRRKVA